MVERGEICFVFIFRQDIQSVRSEVGTETLGCWDLATCDNLMRREEINLQDSIKIMRLANETFLHLYPVHLVCLNNTSLVKV